jgi:catechol 2,3-dioxygenase-like lactoylglutathione lyase family enzyme
MPVDSKNQAIAGLGTHHIAILTRNWDESEKFYGDVLGMEKIAQITVGSPERRIALFDIGDGSHMELFDPTPGLSEKADGHDPVLHFALTTTDIKAAVERVRAAGMKITREPSTAVDFGHLNITVAFFEGPNGEIIEFYQVNN